MVNGATVESKKANDIRMRKASSFDTTSSQSGSAKPDIASKPPDSETTDGASGGTAAAEGADFIAINRALVLELWTSLRIELRLLGETHGNPVPASAE
ncbi:hypothetical protein LTR33_009702 [Friedmanniomyces endolithicus]|nr:hypothetical protein LTR33_009702 [Friedmanniomyces endolithicus]